jgi:AcrR family transcriptional regulator
MAKATARWKGEFRSPEENFGMKRRLLLQEAGRAFSENGFHNTTLDEVAAALRLTKTALYYYFRNKNEILLACCEIGFDIGNAALTQAMAQPGTGLDRLVAFTRLYVESASREIGACAVMSELKSLPLEDLRKMVQRKRDFDGRLRELVSSGIEDGSMSDCDPLVAVNWLMGAATTLPRWYDPDGRYTPDQIGGIYADFARRTFAAP